MKTYPYDPTTGKQLMRSGFCINPVQPMTQEEVDQQHELVNECVDDSDKYRAVREALHECIVEIKQYHDRYHAECRGGCPSVIVIQRARNVIARLEKLA